MTERNRTKRDPAAFAGSAARAHQDAQRRGRGRVAQPELEFEPEALFGSMSSLGADISSLGDSEFGDVSVIPQAAKERAFTTDFDLDGVPSGFFSVPSDERIRANRQARSVSNAAEDTDASEFVSGFVVLPATEAAAPTPAEESRLPMQDFPSGFFDANADASGLALDPADSVVDLAPESVLPTVPSTHAAEPDRDAVRLRTAHVQIARPKADAPAPARTAPPTPARGRVREHRPSGSHASVAPAPSPARSSAARANPERAHRMTPPRMPSPREASSLAQLFGVTLPVPEPAAPKTPPIPQAARAPSAPEPELIEFMDPAAEATAPDSERRSAPRPGESFAVPAAPRSASSAAPVTAPTPARSAPSAVVEDASTSQDKIDANRARRARLAALRRSGAGTTQMSSPAGIARRDTTADLSSLPSPAPRVGDTGIAAIPTRIPSATSSGTARMPATGTDAREDKNGTTQAAFAPNRSGSSSQSASRPRFRRLGGS